MKKILATMFALLMATQGTFAAETTSEKLQKEGRDSERQAKKSYHRAEEAVDCAEGDAKCIKTKSENRAKEAKDATVDKGKEIKDKAD